jgi:DNA-binding transcriptional LysR family regulator
VVEVARLESVYRFIAYRGFESPSLRQETKIGHPRVAYFFVAWRREAGPLRALRGGFEGLAPAGACLPNRAGEEVVASVRPVMVPDDPEAIARAAAGGMGIAMLPLPHVQPLLERGKLMCVLPDWHADAQPLAIYYTSRKLVPAKVRVSVNYIVEGFRADGHAVRYRHK